MSVQVAGTTVSTQEELIMLGNEILIPELASLKRFYNKNPHPRIKQAIDDIEYELRFRHVKY